MKTQDTIAGNDLKFIFSSEGEFSFEGNDWEITFSAGSKSVEMTKHTEGGEEVDTCSAENMGFINLHDGRVVFLLDTSFFGAGRLMATLTVHIPDADFASLDRMREEVRRYDLQQNITE